MCPVPLERVLRDLAVKAQVGEVRLEVACSLDIGLGRVLESRGPGKYRVLIRELTRPGCPGSSVRSRPWPTCCYSTLEPCAKNTMISMETGFCWA